MPLSEAEVAASRDILTYLSFDDLMSLADTVSQRFVIPANAAEAADVAVEFSADFDQLLQRRKVKREHLMRFARKEGILDDISMEKRALIARILRYVRKTPVDVVHKVGPVVKEPETSNADAAPPMLNVMAVEFARWFYGILNDCSKPRLAEAAISSSSLNVFGPHHFCSGASLSLRLENAGAGNAEETLRTEQCRGAEDVAQRLSYFVRNDGLSFDPNLEGGGCDGTQEPHGLVLLKIKGTLQRSTNLLGTFDQSFGLLKQPLTNQWLVQVTFLRLTVGVAPVTSTNGSMTRRALTH